MIHRIFKTPIYHKVQFDGRDVSELHLSYYIEGYRNVYQYDVDLIVELGDDDTEVTFDVTIPLEEVEKMPTGHLICDKLFTYSDEETKRVIEHTDYWVSNYPISIYDANYNEDVSLIKLLATIIEQRTGTALDKLMSQDAITRLFEDLSERVKAIEEGGIDPAIVKDIIEAYLDEHGLEEILSEYMKIEDAEEEFAKKEDLSDYVKTVNGMEPDEEGNVEVEIPKGVVTFEMNYNGNTGTFEEVVPFPDTLDEFLALRDDSIVRLKLNKISTVHHSDGTVSEEVSEVVYLEYFERQVSHPEDCYFRRTMSLEENYDLKEDSVLFRYPSRNISYRGITYPLYTFMSGSLEGNKLYIHGSSWKYPLVRGSISRLTINDNGKFYHLSYVSNGPDRYDSYSGAFEGIVDGKVIYVTYSSTDRENFVWTYSKEDIGGTVKSVNGVEPDADGNVEVDIPSLDGVVLNGENDTVNIIVNGDEEDENNIDIHILNTAHNTNGLYVGDKTVQACVNGDRGRSYMEMESEHIDIYTDGLDGNTHFMIEPDAAYISNDMKATKKKVLTEDDKVVKTVNGIEPDENGNVDVDIPSLDDVVKNGENDGAVAIVVKGDEEGFIDLSVENTDGSNGVYTDNTFVEIYAGDSTSNSNVDVFGDHIDIYTDTPEGSTHLTVEKDGAYISNDSGETKKRVLTEDDLAGINELLERLLN